MLLEGCVASYDALKVIDKKLAMDHQSWISGCGKTVEELEIERHKYSPSQFGPLLDQYCDVSDKVEEQFEKILFQYPNKVEVVTTLSRFKKASDVVSSITKDIDFDLKSACSGKGADYAKSKLPKIKEEISNEYNRIENEFVNLDLKGKPDSEDLAESLNRMFKILDVDGKFDKLLRELEEAEEISEEDADGYENWQKEFLVKIGKLRNKLRPNIKSTGATSKSASFQTFFKKLDPPKFLGDCLEYLEWKTKWKSVGRLSCQETC